MGPIRIRHRDLVVACDLGPADLTDRLEAWRDLRVRFGIEVECLEDGGRLWLRPDGQALAGALVRGEAACCGFLDVELVTEGARLRVDLTSPTPEGMLVARALVGIDDD